MGTNMHNSAARIGLAVQERRKSLGLGQQDLADLAEVSRKFVYSLEHGKPTVRIDKVDAVLRVLGLTLHVGLES